MPVLLFFACILAAAPQDPHAATVAHIADERINEASGIVASRQFEGVYWTHNDGNDGQLFAIRRDGSLIGSVKLDVSVRDWEDITADDQGHLFIADTGNNHESRKSMLIHRVREPDPSTLEGAHKLKVEHTWKLRYPDEPFNCESLIIWRDHGYVISKREDGKPAALYRFKLDDEKSDLRESAALPIRQPVTSAALSPDGKTLAVLTRAALWLFDVNGDLSRVADAKPSTVAVEAIRAEGCTFTRDGIVIVSEGREILFWAIPTAAAQPATGS
jgi:hypothetical protein